MTYSIRRATMSDKEWVVDDLAFDTINNDLQRPELYNKAQLLTIFNSCFTLGRGWVVEKDGKRVGVLGGLQHGHIFNPEHPCFTVAFWFLNREHRGSRAGWLLLKELLSFTKEEGLELSLALQPYSLVNDSLLLKLGFTKGEQTYRRI